MSGLSGISYAVQQVFKYFLIFIGSIFTLFAINFLLFAWVTDEANTKLQENKIYILPDGNKIKIKQEGKNSVIMPANDVVKEK